MLPQTDAAIAVGVTQNDRSSFDMTVASITAGHEDWRQVITGRGKRVDRDDAVLAMSIDPRRKTVGLAGYAQITAAGLLGTPHEFRVVKIGHNGIIAWKYDLDDQSLHLDNAALALTVDMSGDFFAAGVITENPTGPDRFAVGLDVDGGGLACGSRARNVASRSMVLSHVLDESMGRPAKLLMREP